MKSARFTSWKALCLAGLMAVGMLPALALASPVTFNINGHFSKLTFPAGSVDVTFGGTLDVDPVLGTIEGANITVPGIPTFNKVGTMLALNNSGWLVSLSNGVPGNTNFSLNFSTPLAPGPKGSLFGFAGGDILSSTSVPFGSGLYTQATGTITAAVATVPEPAALGMFGLGLLLIGGAAAYGRRRRVGAA